MTFGVGLSACQISWDISYTNLDIDADGTPNDTVNFTVVWQSAAPGLRLFGQGQDEGSGDLDSTTVSVTNVSGITTD